MFESIKGQLIDKHPNKVVVESGGIGYRLAIPLSTYTRLPASGGVHLFLSHVVREDSQTLYAFLEIEERDLFEKLINLSGIGPKTALTIIGHLEIGAFQKAIASADVKLLSKIPGIGKKTAERLVIEMRDKVKDFKGKAAVLTSGGSIGQDALNALLNLGYNPIEAQKAVNAVLEEKQGETDLGKIITAALQKI